jgi:elongation factor G
MTHADPTLHWYQNPELKQTILEGMGGTHIDVAIRRADSFGVGLDTTVPKVPYQETITRTAEAEYTHKKQTGGAGQFGRVSLRVEPLPSPTGAEEDVPEFEFANEVFGADQSVVCRLDRKGVRQVVKASSPDTR